mmetsp:Transcript_8759/g.18954  ORF Transcript_8759/g.18954 Transcript_8759/m.18954 type:complete len:213 (-) Transcript_8759:643-1281(-)
MPSGATIWRLACFGVSDGEFDLLSGDLRFARFLRGLHLAFASGSLALAAALARSRIFTCSVSLIVLSPWPLVLSGSCRRLVRRAAPLPLFDFFLYSSEETESPGFPIVARSKAAAAAWAASTATARASWSTDNTPELMEEDLARPRRSAAAPIMGDAALLTSLSSVARIPTTSLFSRSSSVDATSIPAAASTAPAISASWPPIEAMVADTTA